MQVKNKTLEEYCAKNVKKCISNIRHQALHIKMVW